MRYKIMLRFSIAMAVICSFNILLSLKTLAGELTNNPALPVSSDNWTESKDGWGANGDVVTLGTDFNNLKIGSASVKAEIREDGVHKDPWVAYDSYGSEVWDLSGYGEIVFWMDVDKAVLWNTGLHQTSIRLVQDDANQLIYDFEPVMGWKEYKVDLRYFRIIGNPDLKKINWLSFYFRSKSDNEQYTINLDNLHFSPVASATRSANLVINGGFEGGLNKWELSHPEKVSIVHPGYKSDSALCFDATNIDYWPAVTSARMRVEEKPYRLSSFVKQISGAGRYGVTPIWLNQKGEVIGFDNDWQGLNQPTEFSEHGGVFTPPLGVYYAQIVIHVDPGVKCIFDDVSLTPVVLTKEQEMEETRERIDWRDKKAQQLFGEFFSQHKRKNGTLSDSRCPISSYIGLDEYETPDGWVRDPEIIRRLDYFQAVGLTTVYDLPSWKYIERTKDKLDWSRLDKTFQEVKKRGLKYIFGPALHLPPQWFQESEGCTLMKCREHDQETAVLSYWAPSTLEFYEYCYKMTKEHFGDQLDGIFVCLNSDFSEGGFPSGGGKEGGGYWTVGKCHAHFGFWCNDRFAKADFKKYALEKYGEIGKVNNAWQTDFTSPEEIAYPDSMKKKRYWLDFVDWYHQSAIDFADREIQIIKKYFPKTPIILPPGGFNNPPMELGMDAPGFARMAGKYKIHLEPGAMVGNPFWSKWFSSSYRFYGLSLNAQEPGPLPQRSDMMARLFTDISAGTKTFFFFKQTLLQRYDMIEKYSHYFTGEEPIPPDVVILLPTTEFRLNEARKTPFLKSELAGNVLRDITDYDVFDEKTIQDGALKDHRLLLIFEGNTLEEKTLIKIREWVRAGGVLLTCNFGTISTVEGEKKYYLELFGFDNPPQVTKEEITEDGKIDMKKIYTQWTRKLGKGYTIFFPLSGNGSYELVREVTYNLSVLDSTLKDGILVDNQRDGIEATLFKYKILLFNRSGLEVKKEIVLREKDFTGNPLVEKPKNWKYSITLPAYSIGSISF